MKIHTALTQTVWGSTQENDIASLRKKLEQRPGSLHLIQTHVGVGYRCSVWSPMSCNGQIRFGKGCLCPLDRGGRRLF